MNLDESQKSAVSAWIESGEKIADIQKRLADELDIHMTYMEVRFLVDDLNLQLKDPEVEKQPEPEEPEVVEEGTEESAEGSGIPGDVTVTVDQLVRPGAVVSGKVIFSDGQRAEWFLDQMMRLGFQPAKEGYKPSPEDVQAFQMKLQEELSKTGF